MSGRVSDYLVNQWLDGLRNTWIALHYDNPEVAGAYASEVFGGSYTRVSATFSVPNSRAIWNDDQIYFGALPAVTVTHVAMWDTRINGNYLVSVALPEPVRVLAGRSLSLGPQTFAISLD